MAFGGRLLERARAQLYPLDRGGRDEPLVHVGIVVTVAELERSRGGSKLLPWLVHETDSGCPGSQAIQVHDPFRLGSWGPTEVSSLGLMCGMFESGGVRGLE
jgi:hypothetical protein